MVHDFGALRRNGIGLAGRLGPARFTGPHTVQEDGRSWQGDRIVTAVGGRAAPASTG